MKTERRINSQLLLIILIPAFIFINCLTVVSQTTADSGKDQIPSPSEEKFEEATDLVSRLGEAAVVFFTIQNFVNRIVIVLMVMILELQIFFLYITLMARSGIALVLPIKVHTFSEILKWVLKHLPLRMMLLTIQNRSF